jgi:hypothetical protein
VSIHPPLVVLLKRTVRVKVKPLYNLGAARAGLLPSKEAFLQWRAALLLHPDEPSSSPQHPVLARAQRACNVCSDAPELCACLPRPRPVPCYLLWLQVLWLLLLRAQRTWKGIPGPLRPGRPPPLGDHERCRVARDRQQAAQVCCADCPATPCPTSDRHVLPWSPPLAGSFLTCTCLLRAQGSRGRPGAAGRAGTACARRWSARLQLEPCRHGAEAPRPNKQGVRCCGALKLSQGGGTCWPQATETVAPGACSFDELRTLIQVEVKLDKAAFLSAVVQYIKQVQVRTCLQSAPLYTCIPFCMECVACLVFDRVEL